MAQAGGAAPRRFGQRGSAGSHVAEVTAFLLSLKDRPITAAEFTRRWREETGEIPEVESLSFQHNIGPASSTPIDVQISHPDQRILEAAAAEVADALCDYTGVIEVDDGIARGKPELEFRLTSAARAAGFTATELARQVRHCFYGAEAKRQQRRNEVKVMVRLPQEERGVKRTSIR